MIYLTDLPLEIFYHIRDFLCYIDFQSLRFTCHYFNSAPPQDFKRLVAQKLKKHTDNPEELLNIIDQAKGCISGSFILAVLYDQDFYNDIDIYENPNTTIPDDVYNITSFSPFSEDESLKSGISIDFSCQDTPISNYIRTALNIDPNIDSRGYSMICSCVKNYKIFQHILIPFNLPKFILNYYDIDLCSNMYYGGQLYVKSWDKLFSRTDVTRPDCILGMTYPTVNESKNYIAEKTQKRIEKYNQRGFNITKHPQYDAILEVVKKCPSSYPNNDFHEREIRIVDIFNLENPSNKSIILGDFNWIIDHPDEIDDSV